MPFDDSDSPLAVEIQQEGAAAYFAACRKMVDALEALNAFDRVAVAGAADQERIAHRSELVEEAAERVYYVVIQREAMKLACTETFFEDYGVPLEVRAGLGPRRRN